MPEKSKVISLDAIILPLLVIANITLLSGYMFQKSLYIGFTLLYVLLDFFSNTSRRGNLILGIPVEEHCKRQKKVVLLLIIFLLVVWPALSQIYARHEKGSEYFAHDGLIQTEEAVKLLLEGKNPYTEDYFNTTLSSWVLWSKEDVEKYGINPALYHFAYLPFLPLFTAPFYLVSNAFVGWFDLRFIFIPMFFAVIFVLGRLVKDDSRKIQLLMLFTLNPWFADYFDEGRNDIFILAWMLFALYSLKKNSIFLSSVFLAFACSSKQIAWFILPFYFAYLTKSQFNVASMKEALKKTYPFFIIALIVVAPFLVWDYGSFIDDTLSYLSGASRTSYPAGGYGISTILVGLGFMKNSDYFPFWMLQVLFGLPLLYVLLGKQSKENSIKMMLINTGLLTFVGMFLSRSFNDNYLGYILSLLVVGYYIDD